MLISQNILSSIVNLEGLDPEELGLKLTMATAEIEKVERSNSFFENIITAKIIKKVDHPNSDHLTLVDLETGKENLRVVCGAPNHQEGDIVALAQIGTKFSEDFQIKKGKIRGEESNGMLCSAKELGLSDDNSGILIFDKDTEVGIPLSEMFKNWVDTIYEIDNKSITHRPDLWGHLGFAREIGAIYNREIKDPVNLNLQDEFSEEETLQVKIDIPEKSRRYCGLMVKNIKVQESPEWLKSRLTAIGMRPINNIVDITNYVMAELGEPMHAFDRKKISGDTITVRMAKDGETFTTLDEQELKLTAENIVIADNEKPVALAGVMGGANSEVDENTTEIILEAANFDAVSVRKTAAKFDIRTDAAMRFEKSLDPELCHRAIIRAYELIKESCPEAKAVTKITEAYPSKFDDITINCTTDYIRKALGEDLSDEKIIKILSSLGYEITQKDVNLKIEVPSYRATKDVSMAADIVEEVGRIFGYDNITPVPPRVNCQPPVINNDRVFEKMVKRFLSHGHNLIEVSNYSFVGEDLLNKLDLNDEKELRLKNSLSQHHDRLRRSLVPNIITNIEFNTRYNDNFRIYELDRIYLKEDRTSEELAEEKTMITGAIYKSKSDKPLFYSAKEVVKDLIKALRLRSVRFMPVTDSNLPYVHPGRALKLLIDNKDAGLIFELHPQVKQNFDITGHCAIFDISLDLLKSGSKEKHLFAELPRYPEVPFEISVITDSKDYAENIKQIIYKTNKQVIKSIDVIAIYSGDSIEEGKKSISYKIIFSGNKTFSHEEIEGFQNKIIKALEKNNYHLR